MAFSTHYVSQDDYLSELKRDDGVTFIVSLNKSIFLSMKEFENLINHQHKIAVSDNDFLNLAKIGDVWISNFFSDFYYSIMYAGGDKTVQLVSRGTIFLDEKTQVEYFGIIPHQRKDFKYYSN